MFDHLGELNAEPQLQMGLACQSAQGSCLCAEHPLFPPVSWTPQRVQEAAVNSWVRGSSLQFLGICGQHGATTPELCPLVLSSWIAVRFGVFVGQKSISQQPLWS